MHRSDLHIILLAAASDSVALKHHLTAAELQKSLSELLPTTNARILERAAVLGTTHAKASS